MEEDFDILFEGELKDQIEKIGKLNPGSQEHTAAVDSFAKLYRLKIEEEKNVSEARLKEEQLNDDWKNKEEQKKDRQIDRWINAGLAVIGVGAPLLHNSNWMNKVLEFEKTGSFSSASSRKVFEQLFRFKK